MPSVPARWNQLVCGPVGASAAVFCTTEISSDWLRKICQSHSPLFCVAVMFDPETRLTMTRMPIFSMAATTPSARFLSVW